MHLHLRTDAVELETRAALDSASGMAVADALGFDANSCPDARGAAVEVKEQPAEDKPKKGRKSSDGSGKAATRAPKEVVPMTAAQEAIRDITQKVLQITKAELSIGGCTYGVSECWPQPQTKR